MFAGGLTQQASPAGRRGGGRTATRSSRIRSVIEPAPQLLADHAARTASRPATSTRRINTEIDDFNPKYGRDTYGGQFSRPAGAAADPATYNLADFMFGARSAYALVNPFIANLRQRMHFAYLQDDCQASAER